MFVISSLLKYHLLNLCHYLKSIHLPSQFLNLPLLLLTRLFIHPCPILYFDQFFILSQPYHLSQLFKLLQFLFLPRSYPPYESFLNRSISLLLYLKVLIFLLAYLFRCSSLFHPLHFLFFPLNFFLTLKLI